MHKLLPAILCIFLIAGCKSGPDNNTTKSLAMSYFSQGMGTGGVTVKEDMIQVLKSYEKEGAPVMTFLVGGMICDMPVLETEQGWIARGLSCNGSIYTPAQAQQIKKDQYLDSFRMEAEKLKTNPPAPVNGVQATGMRVESDQVFVEVTIIETGTAGDLESVQLEETLRNMDVEMVAQICSDKNLRDAMGYGIEMVYNIVAADKTPIAAVSVDKDKCDAAAGNYFGLNPRKG